MRSAWGRRATTPDHASRAEAVNDRRFKILLIDDDPDFHQVVELLLGSDKYELTCCRTGAEGLEAMRQQRPDLVLLDIMLTHPSEGLQVAGKMRQDGALKDIPIIIMSAIGERMGADYAKEVCPVPLNADLFLEKPLEAGVVRQAVQSVLTKRYGAAR